MAFEIASQVHSSIHGRPCFVSPKRSPGLDFQVARSNLLAQKWNGVNGLLVRSSGFVCECAVLVSFSLNVALGIARVCVCVCEIS